jgi:predicted alpha/beta-fold hydrolase
MSLIEGGRLLEPVVPRFVPHPWLLNGHWQTVLAHYLPAKVASFPSRSVTVTVSDGSCLLIEDAIPPGWLAGDPAAVLVHGLAGSAQSPYMVRVTARLVGMGVRIVRMNLRNAGAGFGLARGFYHAGKTNDVRAVAEWLSSESSGSPIALVGFSLGGNLVLKLAAEASQFDLEGLDCVVAANAPLDLSACCQNMRRPSRRLYDKNFVKLLCTEVRRLHAAHPEMGPVDLGGVATLYDFDDRYTAPQHGFLGAADYYAQSSAGPLLSRIEVPGLVVHAEDDPFIPVDCYRTLEFPSNLKLELIAAGGHLGYISRNRWGGDRRWLDSRICLWLQTRWETALEPWMRRAERP